MKSIRLLLLMVSGLQFACGAEVETDPARDESFLTIDGKSDSMVAVEEATPEANGILRLVNEASLETLDDSDKIGLDVRAARNIVEYRVENRGIHSLAELDGIGYVGKSAFSKIFSYAFNNGYFSVFIHGVLEGSPQAEAILDVVNVVSFETLDVDVALDRRAAENIIIHRDEDEIDSLAELDRIGYVGESAFSKLSEFTAETIDQVENDRAFLMQMSQDIGAYFFFERTEYASMVEEVAASDLPNSAIATAHRHAKDTVEQNRGGSFLGATPNTYYTISKDDRVIGYVVHIEYDMDYPVFDGGGVHLYLDVEGNVVSDVSWWG